MRAHGERLARLDSEIAEIEAELAQLDAPTTAGPDLAALAAAVDAGAGRGRRGRSRTRCAPKPRIRRARQALDAARKPLAEAERRAQRLDTEAKTLAKLLHVETKNLWPPVIDELTVEKGYETALGAALGDDLDAPVDPHRADALGAAPRSTRPIRRCRKASSRSRSHVTAPPELARRLAQIGVVERADGARLATLLKPGQRLVSREGDLWRWDGFAAAAHAPTGAARRLAGRTGSPTSRPSCRPPAARSRPSGRRPKRPKPRLPPPPRPRPPRARAGATLQREADAAREQHASGRARG